MCWANVYARSRSIHYVMSSGPAALPSVFLHELLFNLFDRDMKRIRVCKTWRRVANDNSLWRHVDLTPYKLNLKKTWKVIRAHFSDVLLSLHLRGLHTPGSHDLMKNSISAAQMKDLQQRCPNIRELTIKSHHLEHIECKELPKKLQVLTLHSCLIPPGWFAGIGDTLSLLTALNIGFSAKTTDLDLRHISKCSQLTSLDLSGCYRISQTGIETIATSLLDLKELMLTSSGGVTDLALHHIARNLKQLEVLSVGMESVQVSQIKYSNSALTNSVALIPSLKKLDIRHSHCDDATLRAFEKMKHLTQLDVSFTKVSLQVVEAFNERCIVIYEGIMGSNLDGTYSGSTQE